LVVIIIIILRKRGCIGRNSPSIIGKDTA